MPNNDREILKTILKEAYNWPVYYRELGYHTKKREEYERSLKYFDTALEKKPDDFRSLYGRADSRSKSMRFQGAKEDIERILALEPDNMSLHAEKALITYLCCEFEKAMILNVRNVRLRKKPDYFEMGVMHCEEAILNCISERAGKPLRDHFRLIRQIAWEKEIERQLPDEPVAKNKKKKQKSLHDILPSTKTDKDTIDVNISMKSHQKKKPSMRHSVIQRRLSTIRPYNKDSLDSVSSLGTMAISSSIIETIDHHNSSLNIFKIPSPPYIVPYRPLQNYSSNIDNYLAECYLDKLYHDKLFFKNLPATVGVSTINQKGSEQIMKLAEMGFRKVYRTQEILRARKPFYFLKYQKSTDCEKLEERKHEDLLLSRKIALHKAEKMIERMESALEHKSVKKVFKHSEQLLTFLEKTPRKVFPKNQEFKKKVVNIICDSFFQRKKIAENLNRKQKIDRIRIILGLQMKRTSSTDSLMNDIKNWCLDWKKMTDLYKKRLFSAKGAEELAWLYHELARFASEMKQYDISRMYAKKCISEANICQNLKWIFNAIIIMTKISINQKNKNEAINQIKRAKKVANILRDKDLVEFCEMSVEIIDKYAFDVNVGVKILEEREKQIIDLIPTKKLKREASFIFRRISSLPMSRRMTILPGFDKNKL